MRQDQEADFLKLIATGETIVTACRSFGMNKQRIYTHRKRHPEFSAKLQQVMADSAAARAELVKQRSLRRFKAPPAPAGAQKRISKEMLDAFLDELARGASTTAAIEAVGISYGSVQNRRHDDPEFARRWEEAVQMGVDRLEDEARRRAVDGVVKPVYQGGTRVGEIREYSDSLLSLILKGKRPEVYARPETSVNVTEVRLTREQALEKLRQLGLPAPFIETEFRREN